ncbi:MAG: AAA family ATPase [Planctomycetota bacterium]
MDSPPLVLDRVLGVGRTGRVWRARLTAPWLGRDVGSFVAVKVLRTELLSEPDARASLGAEIEAGRAVRHPALSRFLFAGSGSPPPLLEGPGRPDVPEAHLPHPEAPWLAMEVVPGRSLEEELHTAGPSPEPTLRAIGRRVAGALAALHAAGWTHGDIKPDNVRFDARGDAVLLDLGFARRVGAPIAPLGTPAYLAPERTHGGPPSPAADIYAFGATLHRLATGQHAAADDDGAPDLAVRASGALRPPSSIVPRSSPLLDELLLACLAPTAMARPTALEVARVFEEGESGAWWRERLTFGGEARRDTAAWSGLHQLPLVGRSEELERMHVAWYLTRAGGGRAVWLEGERGAGKSRLVAELAHRVRRSEEQPPLYLYGRCGELEDERPGAAILALLHRWLHLPREASPGAREAELVQALVPDAEARTLLEALSSEERHAGDTPVTEVAALATWLVRLTRKTPAIVFLDDVDAAGKATLDVIARVARDLAGTKLLLILGVRDDVLPRHGLGFETLRARLIDSERLMLGPLDEAAVLGLVDLVFHHSVPRRSLAKILHGRTGGNPGRIGELLRFAAAKGWTRVAPSRTDGPSVHSAEAGGLLELCIAPSSLPRPASLARAVDARRDALAPRDQVWLERVAVLGGRFAPALVARAFPRSTRSARGALARLAGAGWLVSAGDRFRFARPAEREEIKRGVAPRRRRRYHAAAAGAFRDAAPASEDAYRRVRHLRDADESELLLAELPSLLQRARDAGHPRRRATLAGWGLEALDALPTTPERVRTRRDLLETLADASDRLGEREEQSAALEALADLPLDLEHDPSAAGRVYTLHARAAVVAGEAGLARGLVRNAIELFTRAGEAARDDLAGALLVSARIESDAGDLIGAHDRLAFARATAPGPLRHAEVLAASAEVAALEDRLEAGLASLDEALTLLASADDTVHTRAVRAHVHLVQGRILRLAGRVRRAWVALARASKLADQSGEVRLAVEAAARRGRLMLDVDRERDAELELREALLLARNTSDRRGEALVTLFLGTLLGERADATQETYDARSMLERSLRLAEELGLARIEALCSAILARVERQAGRYEAALGRVQHAAALVQRFGAELLDRIVVDGTHALVLRDVGRKRDAKRVTTALQQRVTRENRALLDKVLRKRHHATTKALMASALSPDGPLYPRVHLDGLEQA